MHRATTILAAGLAAAVIAACGKDSEPEGAAGGQAATTATSAEPAAPRGCEAATPTIREEPDLSAPDLELDRDRRYTAVIDTNCGPIEIRLDVQRSPETAASFVALARDDFYDGTPFHRIGKDATGADFVVQGGDPTGTGNGGPGYSVVEPPPEGATYERGVVAMAKTEIEEAGTSGSQFFIVTAEDAGLPPLYAVVGRVVEGQETVSRIASVPADPADERPVAPVVIEDVTIREGGS